MHEKTNDDNPVGKYKIEAFSEIMDTFVTSFNTRWNPEALDILDIRAIQMDVIPNGVFTNLTDSLTDFVLTVFMDLP